MSLWKWATHGRYEQSIGSSGVYRHFPSFWPHPIAAPITKETKMSHNKSYNMPAQTSPGKAQKRSVPVAQHPAAGGKFARCALRNLRLGSANVGWLNRRCEEVMEMVSKRHLDICCLQETRRSADVQGYLATISYSGWVVGRVKLVLEWWLQKGG